MSNLAFSKTSVTAWTIVSYFSSVFHGSLSKHNDNNNIMTSLVAWWSELLTTNHEIPGSIPCSSLKGEDAHGDHGLGSW